MESETDSLKSDTGAYTSCSAKLFPVHLSMPLCRKTFLFYNNLCPYYSPLTVSNTEQKVRIQHVFIFLLSVARQNVCG